jgi:hypothetical protein
LLISKDWSLEKCFQSKAELVLKKMEDKKKDIWNFSLIHKNQENDKVGFNFA